MDFNIEDLRAELDDYIFYSKIKMADLEIKLHLSYQTIRNFLNKKPVSKQTLLKIMDFIEGS